MKSVFKTIFFICFLICVCFTDQTSNQDQLQEDFIESIWLELQPQIEQLQNRIINTTMIQGMIKGNLDPLCYGRFIVQDTAYMKASSDLWIRACQNGKDDVQFSTFCQKFRGKDLSFYSFLKSSMTLDDYVKAIPIIQAYIEDKVKSYQKHTYHYIAVVNLVCYKLYPTFCKKIIQETSPQNPYYGWIRDNAKSQSYLQMEKQINFYQRHYNRQQIKKDIIRFINHELNFFTVSCPVY